MSMSDPIANFLTLIRNALKARKETVDIPASKIKEQMSVILKKEGYIKNFKRIEDNKQGVLRIYLKYGKDREKTPVITNLNRVSKPGCRIYKNCDQIKPILGGIGISIISTSKGIKTNKDCQEAKIGGEVLCDIW